MFPPVVNVAVDALAIVVNVVMVGGLRNVIQCKNRFHLRLSMVVILSMSPAS
jgi:hypothetical protein